MAINFKKRGRPHPLEEGVLSTIYQKFFAPLVQYKPASHTLKDWMETLFHLKSRAIDQYIVVSPFKMPGHLVMAPYVRIQGIGTRNVSKGARIWTRTDVDAPAIIDVELMGASSNRADQWFSLSTTEWNEIRPNMKDIAELDDDERDKLGLVWNRIRRKRET